ncbi:MAG: ribonuclease H-like domain-containing protein [Methanomicrobiaceae archaeon]|nr:ribonuclease H-like domain-containing protein [Methanomicrobiaceae archaeon]
MGTGPLVTAVADSWRQRIDSQQEYEVVRDGNIFAAGFAGSCLFSSEHARAMRLKQTLSEHHAGRTLEEVFCGAEIETHCGACYTITSREQVDLQVPDPHRIRDRLSSDLTLVRGIGPKTEARLRGRGYATLHDLCSHPRYRAHARGIVALLDRSDPGEMMRMVMHRYPPSHPRLLGLSAFHAIEDFLFFDIETLGLFSRPIILFGAGRIAGGEIEVSQYLLRDIDEEEAAILATCAHIQRDRTALVTFNGRSFDLPYLNDRRAYYGHPGVAGIPHYDLLHFARRRWKHELPDCRLQTLEHLMHGARRTDDVPSAMVPEFYAAYLETGNPGSLIPIVEHNRQDVVTLARLFQRLHEEWYGDPRSPGRT